MTTIVSNAIILAVGTVGAKMAQAFEQQLRSRHPDTRPPTIEIICLLENDHNQVEQMGMPNTFGIQLQRGASLNKLLETFAPDMPPAGDSNAVVDQLNRYPRLRGQITLHQQAYFIRDLLREATGRIFNTSVQDTIARHGMDTESSNRLHVFTLMSLVDGFANGMLPDLPYLVHHALMQGVGTTQTLLQHLVLSLSDFAQTSDEIIEYAGAAARQKDIVSVRISAEIAATLYEIDYYFGNRHIKRFYQQRFEPNIQVSLNNSPLGQGRIFLLENINEDGSRITNLETLTAMVGDWLYYMTTSSLEEMLEPRDLGQASVYSSFGHGSLTVPIDNWIKRARTALQLQLLDSLMPVAEETDAIDITTILATLGVTERELKAAVTTHTKFNDVRLRATNIFVPFAQPSQYLNQLQQQYTNVLSRELVELRGQLSQRRREMVDEETGSITVRLRDYLNNLIDAPNGGVVQAHRFLEALREELENTQQKVHQRLSIQKQRAFGVGELAQQLDIDPDTFRADMRNSQKAEDYATRLGMSVSELQRWIRAAKSAEKTLKNKRQSYFSASQLAVGIGPIPYVWLGLLIIVGSLPLITVGRVFTSSPDQTTALTTWAMLVSLLGITLYFIIRNLTAIQIARLAVQHQYDERLQAHRAVDTFTVLNRLYDELIEYTEALRDDVNDLWQLLQEYRTVARQEWQTVEDNSYLTRSGDHQVVESLLTPELIKFLESRTHLNNVTQSVVLMRNEMGRLSEWIKDESLRSTLIDSLQAFSHQRAFGALRQYDLAEIWARTKHQQQAAEFKRVYHASYPYWQYDPTRASFPEAPRHVIAKSAESVHVADLSDHQFEAYAIENSYALVVTSVRHGFPLTAMPVFTEQLSSAYEQHKLIHPHGLHTRAYRTLLPSPTAAVYRSTRIEALPVMQLFAIGLLLNDIEQESDGFYFTPTKLGNDVITSVRQL
ncbi:MAG: tubulin-like doman-containing protein, partial [Candidatus Promineifilaceae bacterium]